MKRLIVVGLLLLCCMNVMALPQFPKGGNDNDIVVKNGDDDPKNDMHYKFLTLNSKQIVGATEGGLTTSYPHDTWALHSHTHLFNEITNIKDVIVTKAKHADTADHALLSDTATKASTADTSKKSSEATRAKFADRSMNGLNMEASIGTTPIKSRDGWIYEKGGLPSGGKKGQLLYKLSDDNYNFGYTFAQPMPDAHNLPNAVFRINQFGVGEYVTQQSIISEARVEFQLIMVLFYIAIGFLAINFILFVWCLIALGKKANK